MQPLKRIFLMLTATLGLAIVLVIAASFGFEYWHEPRSGQSSVASGDPARQAARGAYLARAGDCMACHTARGGAEYAGGRRIATPFGDLFSPNITPDHATGIGDWSADEFWRALHNGKSRNGEFLYPAFPYPNYTKITRADADDLYAYFKTLPAVQQQNRPHALRFPYNQRPLLALWRMLYFRPGVFEPGLAPNTVADGGQSVAWNRGAYLVQGLGHCNACHAGRNALGATQHGLNLAGSLIPILDWYAPPLTAAPNALCQWSQQELADLLQNGIAARGTASGPMAEVVRESLQYLSAADIGAMALYLKSLPHTGAPPAPKLSATGLQKDPVLKLGASLYRTHCVDCHRENGSGMPPAYPALAGNPALGMPSPVNAIRIVLNGGYPPSTGGNPRPYGMPPYGPLLENAEVAALVSYIRQAWGNGAPPVTATEVGRYRAVPVD
jgi:mono/diheme cytochrome c family protein